MSMSQTRFDAIFSGQTSIAKKVYEAVPIAESWTTRKIMAEMQRLGISQDQRTVAGCLENLRKSGLVNELMKGEFRREGIKEIGIKAVEQKEKEPAVVTIAKPPIAILTTAPLSPMDILGALAVRAANLAGMASELASDISDAAIDVQQHIENNDADTKKLKQLQSILKSIGQ